MFFAPFYYTTLILKKEKCISRFFQLIHFILHSHVYRLKKEDQFIAYLLHFYSHSSHIFENDLLGIPRRIRLNILYDAFLLCSKYTLHFDDILNTVKSLHIIKEIAPCINLLHEINPNLFPIYFYKEISNNLINKSDINNYLDFHNYFNKYSTLNDIIFNPVKINYSYLCNVNKYKTILHKNKTKIII